MREIGSCTCQDRCASFPDCGSGEGYPVVGTLSAVTVEPDTPGPDTADGVYVTYEWLGQLIRKANSRSHCAGCTCG